VRNSFGALAETEYPLCALFEELTGFCCIMENNVRSLLAAQMFLSRDETTGSQFFLRCGYGIGAALSIDGKIWHGVTAQCAEIGHIPVIRRGGKPCHCGKSGCLETIASPAAMAEEAARLLSPDRTPILWQLHQAAPEKPIDVEDVLSAAAGGDAGAAQIVDQSVIALGSALKSVIYLLDPDKIVLYGRMFDHPYYLSRLSGEMQEGMDGNHAVAMEKSQYNRKLDRAAAALLAVSVCFENGGM
jgi:glucokinase